MQFVVNIDSFRHWRNTFEFPAIEARYKPVAGMLASATSDDLLSKGSSIDNAIYHSMTHDDRWVFNCVVGEFWAIYGANRPYGDVLKDYASFFSTRSDWKAKTEDEYRSANMRVVLTLALDTDYPNLRAKYEVIYTVKLQFGEQDIYCLGEGAG